jgi:Family of unknown function (DUF6519)
MKGDFSRNTYRRASQYSRVMMQQGRVQIDADWNEQTSILLGYMRTLTRDLFGEHAGPADDCGFRIVSNAKMKPELSDKEMEMAKKIVAREKRDLGDDELLVLPGRYYVGGLPVDAGQGMRISAEAGAAAKDGLRRTAWLAYLDVWEEYVSADQDNHIRDVALGGVDTCGRARIMWQVRMMFDPPGKDPLGALNKATRGLIRVIANPDETGDSLCAIDPDARYRGPENQLYRIEIQTGSEGGKVPTFKWSRDNGSVTFPVSVSQGTTLTLAHLGRDDATRLVVGDWVELIDEARLAAFGVGQMAQVSAVDPHDLIVTLTLPELAIPLRDYSEAEAASLHALLRRWDHRGAVAEKGKGTITATPGEKIELEDGIIVEFQAGDFRAGDFWYIPARVLTGDVEWEGLPGADGFRPPDGPYHFYAPLAFGNTDGVEDWRCRIARLRCVDSALPAEVPPREIKDNVVVKPLLTRKGAAKEDG